MKVFGLLGLMFAAVLAFLAIATIFDLSDDISVLGGNLGTFFGQIPFIFILFAIALVLTGLGYAVFKLVH